VKILHKALEAAQQEKRASSAYLAAAEDKDRLELVRHKVRQIEELGRRVEALEQEREHLVHEAGLREQQVQALQQHVQLLMDKNQAKQQVICKLSEKVTQDFTQPCDQPPKAPAAADMDFLNQQERMEHLKVGFPQAQHPSPVPWEVAADGFLDMEGGHPGVFVLEIDVEENLLSTS
jgi:hypothetical protein